MSVSILFLVLAVVLFAIGAWSRWWTAPQPFYPAFLSAGLFFWALSQLLVCNACNDHFTALLRAHPPQTQSRDALSRWHDLSAATLSKLCVCISPLAQMEREEGKSNPHLKFGRLPCFLYTTPAYIN